MKKTIPSREDGGIGFLTKSLTSLPSPSPPGLLLCDVNIILGNCRDSTWTLQQCGYASFESIMGMGKIILKEHQSFDCFLLFLSV